MIDAVKKWFEPHWSEIPPLKVVREGRMNAFEPNTTHHLILEEGLRTVSACSMSNPTADAPLLCLGFESFISSSTDQVQEHIWCERQGRWKCDIHPSKSSKVGTLSRLQDSVHSSKEWLASVDFQQYIPDKRMYVEGGVSAFTRDVCACMKYTIELIYVHVYAWCVCIYKEYSSSYEVCTVFDHHSMIKGRNLWTKTSWVEETTTLFHFDCMNLLDPRRYTLGVWAKGFYFGLYNRGQNAQKDRVSANKEWTRWEYTHTRHISLYLYLVVSRYT